jgi:hypothetical protein
VFLAALQTDLVQRGHHLLAAGLLLLGGLRELDDGVHAGALAFSGDNLLGRLRAGGVGWEGDDRADGGVAVEGVCCGRVHLGSAVSCPGGWAAVCRVLGAGLRRRWLIGDLAVGEPGAPLGPFFLEEFAREVFRAVVLLAEAAQSEEEDDEDGQRADDGRGTLVHRQSAAVEGSRVERLTMTKMLRPGLLPLLFTIGALCCTGRYMVQERRARKAADGEEEHTGRERGEREKTRPGSDSSQGTAGQTVQRDREKKRRRNEALQVLFLFFSYYFSIFSMSARTPRQK